MDDEEVGKWEKGGEGGTKLWERGREGAPDWGVARSFPACSVRLYAAAQLWEGSWHSAQARGTCGKIVVDSRKWKRTYPVRIAISSTRRSD
jgi:hypothetical protein